MKCSCDSLGVAIFATVMFIDSITMSYLYRFGAHPNPVSAQENGLTALVSLVVLSIAWTRFYNHRVSLRNI